MLACVCCLSVGVLVFVGCLFDLWCSVLGVRCLSVRCVMFVVGCWLLVVACCLLCAVWSSAAVVWCVVCCVFVVLFGLLVVGIVTDY